MHNGQVSPTLRLPSVAPVQRRIGATVALISLLVSVLVTLAPSATAQAVAAPLQRSATQVVPAAAVVGFQPGNIISDAVFFNSATMTAGEVDSFLRGKVASCRSGYVCLKDYRQSTPNRNADSYCNGYSGAANESAATIIYKAAQSCGVNPQVLIVMLEKEQSLVTHTWPSSWRYDMALGQGCPDTAPCDPAFSGFFYQIYGAARQMKIYAEGKYFTWYAPGKTWNILYNPNAACGSSPVYIANKATAALYYYTPYQPNSAAIAAGWGTGDSCSAYGNRNFYNFFTSWFGSTQVAPPVATGAYLARAGSSPEIFLITNGYKHYVRTVDDLTALSSVLGAVRGVDQSVTASIPSGQEASRYVHDPRTGTLYLLDPTGTKLRFRTANDVARFGYNFSSYLNLDGGILDRFKTGKDIGTVVRPTGSPDVYLIEGSTVRHIVDSVALDPLVTTTAIASMNPTRFASMTSGAKYFGSARLVRPSDSPHVFLTTAGSSNIYVPSLTLAKTWGASGSVSVVPAGSVANATKTTVGMAGAVKCGTDTRIIDGSGWKLVSGTLGVTPTTLTAGECAAIPKPSGATIVGPVFVTATANGKVYMLENNTLRHVSTYDLLVQLNGNRPVVTAKWSQDIVSQYAIGSAITPAPTVKEGELIQFAGKGEVYLFRSGSLHHVATYDSLVKLAGGKTPTVRTLDAGVASQFTIGLAIARDGSFIQFSGKGEVYVVKDAKLSHVQSYATLLQLSGGKPSPTVVSERDGLAAYAIGNPTP